MNMHVCISDQQYIFLFIYSSSIFLYRFFFFFSLNNNEWRWHNKFIVKFSIFFSLSVAFQSLGDLHYFKDYNLFSSKAVRILKLYFFA